jgi:ligand-binding SRPBCC domain-containing protein
MPVLEREAVIDAPRQEVFAFFEDPRNLRKLTPGWMKFSVQAIDDLPVRAGFRIKYTIRWLGIPMGWETLIAEWEEPVRFVDVQVKGPYRSWRHEHTFDDLGGRTLMRDCVQYELPFGILGAAAHRLVVARQLKQIFDYRARRIRRLFAARTPATAG